MWQTRRPLSRGLPVVAVLFFILICLRASSALEVTEVTTPLDFYKALQDQSVMDIEIQGSIDFADSLLATTTQVLSLARNVTISGKGDMYPVLNFRYIANRIIIQPQRALTFHKVFLRRAFSQGFSPNLDLLGLSPLSYLYLQSTVIHLYTGVAYPLSVQLLLSATVRSPDIPGNQTAGLHVGGWCFPGVTPEYNITQVSKRVCWENALDFTDMALRAHPVATTSGTDLYYNVYMTNSIFVYETILPQDCLNTSGFVQCNAIFGNALIELEDLQDAAERNRTKQLADEHMRSSRHHLAIWLPCLLGGLLLLGVLAAALIIHGDRKRRTTAESASNHIEDGTGALPLQVIVPKVELMCAEDMLSSKSSKGPETTPTHIAFSTGTMDSKLDGSSTFEQRWGNTDAMTVVTHDTPVSVPLNLSFSEVQLSSCVRGSGQFGQVVEATYQGTQVAVKVIHPAVVMSPKNLASFQHEARILSRCSHPNVVTLLGACLHPPRMFLVEELMAFCLRDIIHDSNREFGLAQALSVARDVALGLSYLHPTILHRDLKPGNILLDNVGTAKISDFGLARLRESTLVTTSPEAGTASYMAPECFDPDSHSLTPACDVYSLGVMINEMVTRKMPWDNMRNVVIAVQVSVLQRRPDMEADEERCPKRLRKLIEKCWQHDFRKRPAAAEVAKELTLIMQKLTRTTSSGNLQLNSSQPSIEPSIDGSKMERSTDGSR